MSLGELGIAFRTSVHALRLETKHSQSSQIIHTWLGTHLTKQGIDDILKQEKKPKKTGKGPKEESIELQNIKKVFSIFGKANRG